MARDLADRLLERVASAWNMYGPTETTIWSTVDRVKPGNGPILIGRPIANTEAYILDHNLQLLPVGAVGELYIGGDGLARGYLNRPELTEERFIPHPFKEGARLYNTGDLARYRPDGAIECQGRADHQVKIRGYRIELGEIEAVLRKHENVLDAHVIVREDVPGNRRLVAYFVPRSRTGVRLSELSRFLALQLPDYMLPSEYMLLSDFPLTPNGKVDRKALPAPEKKQHDAEGGYVAPRGLNEELIAGLKDALRRADQDENVRAVLRFVVVRISDG